ncbi:phosphoserine transaminase [Canibacter zhoujuaniae]|uniref:phosphoserine transaminase n=1 Tax=Canibacter zhoujuaniae TaxID=2708343 RepID=UPI0014241547|nr:phosphoserine transaminase [Canibacter zhoujuaniae]
MAHIEIPAEIRPVDGRFGCGPSKVRDEQVSFLASLQPTVLGTSHRQASVKNLVNSVQEQLRDLFRAPEGYEIVLGNGGATSFWDAAVHSLIKEKGQFATCGEFSSKFAAAAKKAPWLADPAVIKGEPGTLAQNVDASDVDIFAYAHNETSTGVMSPIRRYGKDGQLTVVDATSAAGGIDFDAANVDVYYFSPQKNFASDGGIWFALMSPAAIARIAEIDGTDRYIPDTLNLQTAVNNSRLQQTLNTPAIAPLALMDEQLRWILSQGGLEWASERTKHSSQLLYTWAAERSFATPFVADADARSQVVATIDFNADVDASAISKALRANGIVDTEPYRKLGRNQLRIATFTAIDPADVEKLIACIDYVVERLD